MVRKTLRNLRKTNKLWVFCEGKTERLYFQRVNTVERARIKIVSKEAGISRADQILNQAKKFQNKEFKINGDSYDKDRDIIVCVFDRDDNYTSEVFEYVRSKSQGILLGDSNPCFEYWILCHDSYYPSTSYDQSQVCSLVQEKFGFDPKKESELYDKTKDKINIAKTNAKQIQKIHENNNIELISRKTTLEVAVGVETW